MANDRKRVRVIYDSIEAFFEHGRKVDETIEKDTGYPVIQTKSLPPFIVPQELTQSAIDTLKAMAGIKVEDIPDDD